MRGGKLRGAEHVMDTPSAQVKSALLLAGLQADGVTRVVEPVRTRDHTERMLGAMAAPIRVDGSAVEVRRAARLDPLPLRVPGDLSSAAFWIVAAAFHPRALVELPGVGVNPTRAGILRLLPVARVLGFLGALGHLQGRGAVMPGNLERREHAPHWGARYTAAKSLARAL